MEDADWSYLQIRKHSQKGVIEYGGVSNTRNSLKSSISSEWLFNFQKKERWRRRRRRRGGREKEKEKERELVVISRLVCQISISFLLILDIILGDSGVKDQCGLYNFPQSFLVAKERKVKEREREREKCLTLWRGVAAVWPPFISITLAFVTSFWVWKADPKSHL